MASKEAYMLPRDKNESQRLDEQHVLFTEFFGGQLLHPTIPRSGIEAVADVGTGTGAWLLDTAQALRSCYPSKQWTFVGFDISAAQFPSDVGASGVEFVEHDVTRPFDEGHRGIFDVVHVRFLSYAIKALDVEEVVRNVVSLLKPGGFIDWQDGDVTDAWTTPETESMRKRCLYILSERVARGLTPTFVTPLLRTLFSLRAEREQELEDFSGSDVDKGTMNLLTWNKQDLVRVLQVETRSSFNHPSPLVNERKTRLFNQTGTTLMQLGASRRRQLAQAPNTDSAESRQLLEQAHEMEQLAVHPDFENTTCDAEFTWIVARNAVFASPDEPWNESRHP